MFRNRRQAANKKYWDVMVVGTKTRGKFLSLYRSGHLKGDMF